MPVPSSPPIGLHLARTARVATQAFERAMADAGSSASTWQVLVLVRAQQWGTQTKLAQAMGITAATLTHHLNALEEKGLVHRWREDGNRRVQQVALTDQGEEVFGRLRKVAAAHDARVRSTLTNDELDQLAKLLHKLRAGIDEHAAEPGAAS